MEINNLHLHVNGENLMEVSRTVCQIIDRITTNKITIYYHKIEDDFSLSFEKPISVSALIDILDYLKVKRLGLEQSYDVLDVIKMLEKNAVCHVKIIRKD